MYTSKFLTASLTALAVVGSAGFVYAQTTTTPDSSVQAQPPAPVTGDANRSTDTLGQGTDTTNQDRSMDQQLAARADRN